MRIPRPQHEPKRIFRENVPTDSRVTIRQMFGNESAFVNGNMFLGLFGNVILVRLSEEDCKELLKQNGIAVLEPSKRTPHERIRAAAQGLVEQPETIRKWVSRSLNWAGQLPERTTKK